MTDQRNRATRRGGAVVELAVSMPMLVMLSMGVLSAGLTLDRYLAVQQIGRNTASMFSRDTDFSLESNKELVLRAATGMQMTTTGGQGVIYLSRVVLAPTGTANANSLVVAEHHVIGNSSLAPSTVLGSLTAANWPNPDLPLPNGEVKDYADLPGALASLPPVLSGITATDSVFVVEVYHKPHDLLFAGDWMFSPKWISARVIF